MKFSVKKYKARYIDLEIGKTYVVNSKLMLIATKVPPVVTIVSFYATYAWCEGIMVHKGQIGSIHRSWLIAEASELFKALL
jgi:hypothetical protein